MKRGIGFAAIAALVAGFLLWVGVWEPEYRPEAIDQMDSVPGSDFDPEDVELPEDDTEDRALEGDQDVAFPALDTVEVALHPGEATGVEELGVTIEPVGEHAPSSVEIALREASANDGLHWEIERTDGSAEAGAVAVTFDYNGYRNAGGADWDDRLALYGADGAEIPSAHNAVEGTLTAEIPLSPGRSGGGYAPATGADTDGVHTQTATAAASVTMAASDSGDNGTFAATTLAPSSSWSAGNPTGDFAWSYPIDAPTSAGGLDPSIGIAYSSSAVDGRNEATNNQPSIIGEGFSFDPGFIERSYTSCLEDDEDDPNSDGMVLGSDVCWKTDNAVLSLNGSGGEIVKDDATGEWRLKNDDNSRIERLTGAHNGDDDGEYWKVTTAGGIQYFFGLNRLPGHETGDAETDSTATVPVFGNHSGEPCHATDFADSVCDQAWRWQLDWVVDTHGNAIAYFYEGETNHYTNIQENDRFDYDRAVNLSRIDYGLRSADAYAGATNQVVFDLVDRCVEGAACDDAHPENWPDTPLDQACASDGTGCENLFGPTFWTDQMLDSITTRVNVGGAWTDVDTWALDHAFPDPGDSTRAGLWLEGIQRTGLAGDTPIAMPATTFDGVQLYNRVQQTLDTKAPMNWFRISAIRNGTGGVTTVNYTDQQCDAKTGAMPSSPEHNDMRCMPVVLTPAEDNGGTAEYDWYHKYLVTEVADIDTVGDNPPVTTSYEYLGDPAWRFADDDGLTDPDYKTWNQYRGYGTVRTLSGDGSDDLVVTETVFFRGLDGQELPDGTTTSVKVDGVTDHDEYAGRPRSQISYLDGAVLSETTYTPWRSEPTATRVRDWATVHARYTGTSRVESTSRLADGSWRVVASETTYDSWGMAVETESSGDAAVSGDEDCTRITYARNTSAWIVDKVVRTRAAAVDCDTTPAPDDVISDERIYYDGATTYTTPPTKGDMTSAEVLSGYDGTTPQYLNIGSITVDQYGRGRTRTDVDGNVTTTEYTPATGGPVTGVTTVNALGHEESQVIDPLRGNTLRSIDANGNLTEMEYDALGRLTAGWTPDRTRADGYDPVSEFEYLLRDDAPSVTITHGVNANNTYTTTYELFDGLGRSIQTQLPAPDGGRILTATYYDTRGKVHKRHGAFYNAEDPSTAFFTASDNDVPGTIVYEYDTAARQTAEVTYSHGIEQYRTTSVFDGDEVTVIDPDGRGATSVVDAKGNTVEVRNLHTSDPNGAYDSISYEYNAAGQVIAMTDPGGSTWTYEYDLRGRQTAVNDPDTGRTETTYYDNGLTESVTDVTGQSLWYEYDELGRPIYVMKDDFYGDLVEAYEYDLFGLGLPATSSTWDEAGNLYKTRVLGYDAASRPVGVRYTLDGDFGGLDRSFDFRYGYNPDGSVAKVSYPSAGSLAGEEVITTYSDLGLPQATYSARQWYVSDTAYTKFAEIAQLTMDPDGPNVATEPVAWQSYTYEDGTRRMSGATFEVSTGPDHMVADLSYAYSDGGLITAIDNQSDLGADTQCFAYDHLKRITDAWTGATPAACDAEPTSATDVGGAAPYWQSWTFDADGNRESQIDHLAGETIDYTYDPAQPHTLTEATVTDPAGTKTLSYAYDPTGNTTSRPDANGNAQTLAWSPEGELESSTTGGDTTDFDYTADGNRISRTDPDGTMTVFLPGMEVVQAPDGTVTASRYYMHGAEPVAIRTNDDSVSWLAGDHLGTTTATVDADTHTAQVRYFDIYGNERGTPVATWVDDHGFLGGTKDPTGLTHIGAREYDPLLGRFISADPLIDPLNSQQMGGYAYANHSPVTYSDPSGLCYQNYTTGEYEGSNCGGPDGVSDEEVVEIYEEEIDNAWEELEADGISEDVVEAAQDIMSTSLLDVVIDAGLSILLDFLGVNDIMACVGEGDMWACGSLLLDFIPWTKVFKIVGKLAKAAKKIYKAITGFFEKLEWAKGIIKKVEDAMGRAYERAKQRVDDLRAKRGDTTTCELPKNSFTADTEVVMADGSTKPIDEVEAGEEVLATDEETGEAGAHEVVTVREGTSDRTLVDFAVDTDLDGEADAEVTATDEHPIWVADPATTTQVILAQSAGAFTDSETTADPSTTEGVTGSGGGGPPDANLTTVNGTEEGPGYVPDAVESAGPAEPLPGQWVNAIDLKVGQLLRTSAGTWIQVAATETRTGYDTVHNLTVAGVHTYHVSVAGTDFLAHNCGSTEFYTVQGPDDAARLEGGGAPFPTDPTKAHFGPGVYAWGNMDDAISYAQNKPGTRIMTFSVSNDDLASFNQAHISDAMPQDEIDELMSHSSLYGNDTNHGLDYISRPTGRSVEHFFSANIFGKLKFK